MARAFIAPAEGPPASARRFLLRLVAIVAFALAIRLAYALHQGPKLVVGGDALVFHDLANLLADGHGYVQPAGWAQGHSIPTADHPPLYPLVLAIASKLGGTGFGAHRVVSCLLGAGTVGAVGFLGRRVAGERTGLIVAVIAAVYPMLWVVDGSLMSESLYGLLIALSLLAAYALRDAPSDRRAALMGVLLGLAVLTRSEALGLVPLLALPVALRVGARRWRRTAVMLVGFALVVSPWLVRNWIVFDQPLLSNNSGSLLAGANCDGTYHGRFLGLWRLDCIPPERGDEAQKAAAYRSDGIDYAGDHAGRLPAVLAVRVLRTWDLWDPWDQAAYETFEGRDLRVSHAGLAAYWLLLPLSAAGAVTLRRRRESLWLLLSPLLLVTAASLAGYGLTRFRLAAEIPIVVLAGVAVAAAVSAVGVRLSTSAPAAPSS